MNTITENDMKQKMIEFLQEGWENIDYVKSLFFSWATMFDADEIKISSMMEDVFNESEMDESARGEYEAELYSMLE